MSPPAIALTGSVLYLCGFALNALARAHKRKRLISAAGGTICVLAIALVAIGTATWVI